MRTESTHPWEFSKDGKEHRKLLWYSDELWEDLQTRRPFFARLADRNLIPEITGIERTEKPDGILLRTRRIPGRTAVGLSYHPAGLVYEPAFAQRLADLSQGLHEEKAVHEGFQPRNIMYTPGEDRCMAVDVDEIYPSENGPLGEAVAAYAVALINTYIEPFTGHFWRHEALETGTEQDVREALVLALELKEACYRRPILSRIHPEIIDFAVRGVREETCPDDFSQLYSI